MNPRRHLNVHVGNLCQLAGVGLVCYGIWRIAGLGIALIVAGVALALLANFEWDASVWRLPLPLAPKRPKWARGTFVGRLRARARRLVLRRA